MSPTYEEMAEAWLRREGLMGMPPDEAAARSLTALLSEVAREAEERGRHEALEEAEKVCIGQANTWLNTPARSDARAASLMTAAVSIRALAGKEK